MRYIKIEQFYVYEWYIVQTQEVFYVGKGKNNRWKSLQSRNKFFIDMYNSHECDTRIVYDKLTETEAFAKEKELIKYYRENTKFRLTNQTDGGEGTAGRKFTPEELIGHSKRFKLLWENPDYREKMRKMREESGIYQSQEFRDKISKLVKGENNPNYQNYWTDDQKRHLSDIAKKPGRYKNEKNPTATKIICLETGEVFECIKHALKKYNVKNEASFTAALNNIQRTAAEMHWRRFEERLLDEEVRFEELANSIIAKKNGNPIICIETREIYKFFIFCNMIGETKAKVKYWLIKNGTYKHNNCTYMYLKEYSKSHM